MFAVTLTDAANHALGVTLRVALIVVVALVVRWLAHRAITRGIARTQHRMSSDTLTGSFVRSEARLGAVASMARNLASVSILTIALLMVLGELSINLGPLLAGAGVAGIAIGFGAQSLVRDLLAGFFVVIEDQYGVGDFIVVGTVSGTVERITLRSTELRDMAGTVWHIPNGTIQQVGNKSQNWARAVVEIVVAHGADLRAARATMRRIATEMESEPDWSDAVRVGGQIDDQGIAAMTPLGVTLRLVVDTEPKMQWSVERELRLRIKEAFEAEGIPLEIHQFPGPLS